MFGFLNTTFLLGLVGIGIPILIHMFAKRQKKRIEFSSTIFLKQLQNQNIRKLKLKQLLLLILRCLAILFIVTAFARPTFRSNRNTGKKIAKSSVVIVGDRTMSMSRTGFDSILKEKAGRIIDLLRPDDEAAFLWTVSHNDKRLVLTHHLQNIKTELNEISGSAYRVSIPQKIDEAVECLTQSKNINREIFLISDLQKTNFDIINDSTKHRSWDVKLYVLPVSGETENIGIVDAGVENRIREPGSSLTLFADLKNYGKNGEENLLVRVSISGQATDQKLINLNGGENKRLRFHTMPLEPGWHTGKIKIEEDILLADNVWYLTFYIPKLYRVLLVGTRREDILPIRLALSPQNQKNDHFKIIEKLSDENWTEILNHVDIVFLSNYQQFKRDESQLLMNFIEDGGGVFYLLGSDVDIRNLNGHFLEPFFSFSIVDVMGQLKSSKGFFSFGSIDFEHPLFDGIFEKGRQNIQSPRIYRIAKLTGKQSISIVSTNSGDPLLTENHIKNGTVLFLTTGLSEHWSDLSISTFFPPLIMRSAAMLSQSISNQMGKYTAGDLLQFSTGIENIDDVYFVEIPSGDRFRVFPNIKNEKALLNYRSTESGIYVFFRGEQPLMQYAVNFDTRESDLLPINKNGLKQYFQNADIIFVDNSDQLKRKVMEARRGRELWRECLFVALLLLVVEMFISRTKKSQYSDER